MLIARSLTYIAFAGALTPPAFAVRVNPDGHGQALIYPYYTTRSTPSGNAYVTAISVVNTMPLAKAVKVRFLEGRNGAEVLDFNLYLAAYDVWTAGVVPKLTGAGIFTTDHSCTSPTVSGLGANPTPFRSAAYVGDTFGDGLDRTGEGYFEMLEMGTIAAGSALEAAVTHSPNLSSPNASTPACGAAVPTTDAPPASLLKPTGGLIGNISLINVNEGTDYSVDAIALVQWSNEAQWGAPGNLHPNLSDAKPTTSVVVDSREDGDRLILTEWSSGRDAVSALFTVERVINDYSVEPTIKAATDWVLTMPTKRFYVQGTQATAPFVGERLFTNEFVGEPVSLEYYDREQQSPGAIFCFAPGPPCGQWLPFATTVLSWMANNAQIPPASTVFASINQSRIDFVSLNSVWINGWGDMNLAKDPRHSLVAPVAKSRVVDLRTGAVTASATLTYAGLPVVGFAAQSYSTSGLPGINPNVLSNYGGTFLHKTSRKIVGAP